MVEPEGNEEMIFMYLWEEHFRKNEQQIQSTQLTKWGWWQGRNTTKSPSGSWESKCWGNGPIESEKATGMAEFPKPSRSNAGRTA